MISLELLLAGLLVATLALGVRLERKLRALRDSQAGFVKAMQELDGAASRTQTGLEKLRQATDEARGALLPRIEAAQSAAIKLEHLTGDAEIAAKRAEAAAREVEAAAAKLASAIARPRPPVQAPAERLPEPQLRAPAQARPEPQLQAPAPGPAQAAAPASGPAPRPPEPEAQPRLDPKRVALDFAAMLAAKTTRQPLPAQDHEPAARSEPGQAGSRLREAAALLRGG